jgi:hypothetical protein
MQNRSRELEMHVFLDSCMMMNSKVLYIQFVMNGSYLFLLTFCLGTKLN